MLLAFVDRHPFGTGMLGIGSGISATGISFWQQLDLMIRVAGGAVALLLSIVMLILHAHKLFCLAKTRGWFGLCTIAAAFLMFTGCSAVPARIPTVSPAAVSVLTAATANAKALRSNTAARASLTSASANVAKLSTTATPEQKPIVEQLAVAIDATSKELAATGTELQTTSQALTQSTEQVGDLQKQLFASVDAKDAAEKATKNAEEARDFWRSVTWKLALVALALTVWTFRKPIAALCGVPTWLPV